MNILRMLFESEEEWLTESVIKKRLLDEEPPPSGSDAKYVCRLVDRLLETLVDNSLIEFRVGIHGEESYRLKSYRLTAAGQCHYIREQARRETIIPPSLSSAPAPANDV